jgi:hypothetical protein
MKTALMALCLGVLVGDVFFCGGGKQPLTTAEQSKFDSDLKRAGGDLSAIEDALKPLEIVPGEAAFTDLAALDRKLAAAEEPMKVVQNDVNPRQILDEERKTQLADLKDRRTKLDERLTAVYRKRVGADACDRLDAAMKAAGRLDALARTDLSTAAPAPLRDMGDEVTRAEQSLAAVKEFIDGPAHEQIRDGQRKRLEAATRLCADLKKRCDEARQARGGE